jgi:hypothetical protein
MEIFLLIFTQFSYLEKMTARHVFASWASISSPTGGWMLHCSSASHLFMDMWAGIIKSNTTHPSASVINADGTECQKLNNVIESHSTPQSWLVVSSMSIWTNCIAKRWYSRTTSITGISREASLRKRWRAPFVVFNREFKKDVMQVVSREADYMETARVVEVALRICNISLLLYECTHKFYTNASKERQTLDFGRLAVAKSSVAPTASSLALIPTSCWGIAGAHSRNGTPSLTPLSPD